MGFAGRIKEKAVDAGDGGLRRNTLLIIYFKAFSQSFLLLCTEAIIASAEYGDEDVRFVMDETFDPLLQPAYLR